MNKPSVDPNVKISPAATSGAPASVTAPLADLNTFVAYLKRICALILDSSLEDIADIDRLFSNQPSLELIGKFIGNAECQKLVVSKTATINEDAPPIESDSKTDSSGDTLAAVLSLPSSNGVYVLSTEVHYINPKMRSLVVLKCGQLIENDKEFHTQLRIINLADSSPYETLHAFIVHVIGPYFKSYMRESSKNKR